MIKELVSQFKELKLIEKVGFISSIVTIASFIGTINIVVELKNLSYDWIFGFLAQTTFYSITIGIYVAILYTIKKYYKDLKEYMGFYLYIVIVPVVLILTMLFITGLEFIDIINFVGFEI